MRKFLLLLPLLFFFACPAHAAITLDDACTNQPTPTATISTPITCTFTNNIISTDTIIGVVTFEDNMLGGVCVSENSLGDSAGSSYTANACSYINFNDGGYFGSYQSFITYSAGAGSGKLITLGWAAGHPYKSISAIEIGGLGQTSAALDAHTLHDGSSGSGAWNAVTTTNANDIVVGIIGSMFQTGMWSSGAPWTLGAGNTGRTAIIYQIVSSTGTYTPGIGNSGSIGGYIKEAFALKAASAANVSTQIGGFLVGP